LLKKQPTTVTLRAQTHKARNLIERLFRRLKEFRRIATRYEKLDRHFAAMIMLACVCLWLT